MAGTRSLYSSVILQDDDAFNEDAPLSAMQTLTLRNNVQHLVDASCQYRVHWCESTASEPQTASAYSPFYWVFPLTITDRNHYPSFDVRIATRLSGAVVTGSAIATLTTVNGNTPIFSVPFAVSLAAATWHSQSEVVPYPWFGSHTWVSFQDPTAPGALISAATTNMDYIMCKLTVTTVAGAGVGDIHLCGVQLREYLSQ